MCLPFVFNFIILKCKIIRYMKIEGFCLASYFKIDVKIAVTWAFNAYFRFYYSKLSLRLVNKKHYFFLVLI